MACFVSNNVEMRVSLMERAADDQADLILTHPRHQQALNITIGLISELRCCRTPSDFYGFQDRLFDLVLEIERCRGRISRVIKRMKKLGGTVPRDAPDLGTGLDPSQLDSWQLEAEVFERVWRQYKSIADALAWRAFGFDRRVIVALSRNDSPGPMNTKAGLAEERQLIADAWRQDGEFVLHHDLTAALRVGDLSIFRADGTVLLHEVKTNQSRRIRKQDQLLFDTSVVLADGGTLPSGITPARTPIPLVTHLPGLGQLLDLAHQRDGVQGGIVSSGRAVVAVSQYAAAGHFAGQELADRVLIELARGARKIGAQLGGQALTLTSLDGVARSPVRPPWAIYPLAPHVAASLTADAMFFFVRMSSDRIIDRLAKASVVAEWLQPLDGPVEWTRPLLRVAAGNGSGLRHATMNPEAMTSLLLEFVDLDTWCRQIALTLTGDVSIGVRPWPCFAEENKVWA